MAYGKIWSYEVKSPGLNLVLSVQVALTENSPLGIRAHSLICSLYVESSRQLYVREVNGRGQCYKFLGLYT